MSKHTPGPWEIVQMDHGIVVRTESPKKTRYDASRYAVVGGFERSDPEQLAEAIANARLIAAAPDLLKSLVDLVGLANAAMREVGEYDIETELADARAAIAKAEGKA